LMVALPDGGKEALESCLP